MRTVYFDDEVARPQSSNYPSIIGCCCEEVGFTQAKFIVRYLRFIRIYNTLLWTIYNNGGVHTVKLSGCVKHHFTAHHHHDTSMPNTEIARGIRKCMIEKQRSNGLSEMKTLYAMT